MFRYYSEHMTFNDLQNQITLYAPALRLDSFLSARTRRHLTDFASYASLFFALILIGGSILGVQLVSSHVDIFKGLLLISLVLLIKCLLINSFYNSYYFSDVIAVLDESRLIGHTVPLSYSVAQIVYTTDVSDVTAGFLHSSLGAETFARLGLTSGEITRFLSKRTSRVTADSLVFPDGVKITALRYTKVIFDTDKELAQFLFEKTIQEKEFVGAAEWIGDFRHRTKSRARWWGKDGLGRIPSIGTTWSYGQTGTLGRFANELTSGSLPTESGVIKAVEELETILARSNGSNALIVSEASGSGEMSVLYGLIGLIKNGVALPPLVDKRVFQLDSRLLVDTFGEKVSFESGFTKVMNEVVSAGNIILFFDDLPSFIQSAKGIGVDIPSLINPFLTSSDIKIVAFSDKIRFHELIEPNPELVNVFEIVRIIEKDTRALIVVLESEVAHIENKEDVFFSYPAIEAIAEGTLRLFDEASAIEKAKDLFRELPAVIKQQKRRMVSREDVLTLLELKTGVPQEGTVKDTEREKLLTLETLLHNKVIGQDEAVTTISNAMRRSRAGLRNPNKPIGSFLFLGPTGVGKTETAKALAEVFFGKSAPILRLDMSEYSGSDALSQLIGSFTDNRIGVLTSLLRDQQYGVLLLDEFEKTTPEVLNLFLQILDEGFFSDMHGKKINARNIIVIATSNAGSEAIFEIMKKGGDLVSAKDELLESIIASGKFKPELLNRFDGVILFHPLDESHLKQIASLMIDRLRKLLKEQGFDLVRTDDLVSFLVTEGFDPKFGAREMNRILQEKVEKMLAEQLIRGDLTKGTRVEMVWTDENHTDLQVHVVETN